MRCIHLSARLLFGGMDHDPPSVWVGKEQQPWSKRTKPLHVVSIEELFNQGNLDAAEEIVTPDFVLHDPKHSRRA
jgi:hypothetical protein